MSDIVEMLKTTDPWESPQEAIRVMEEAATEIEMLRTEVKILASRVGKLEAECFSLAAWQCEFTDGKTGLMASEGGSTYCAMAKENKRLRAALTEIALKPLPHMHAVYKARAALTATPAPKTENE